MFFLLPVLRELLRTWPGRSLRGSKQAAAPKTGGEQLLPRATFLSQILSTLLWNSCNLWPEIFQKHLEGLQAFLDAWRTASILGCREGLQAFWDAERGCKLFGMLRGSASILGCWTRRSPFLKEEVLGSSRGLGAFVGNTESLQTVESLGFFVGSFKGASR